MKQVYLAEIELLAMDVDGVLTDGTLIIYASGVRPSHRAGIRKSEKRSTKAVLLPLVRSWFSELKADFIKCGSKS